MKLILAALGLALASGAAGAQDHGTVSGTYGNEPFNLSRSASGDLTGTVHQDSTNTISYDPLMNSTGRVPVYLHPDGNGGMTGSIGDREVHCDKDLYDVVVECH
jgi:hypothetical protein